MKLSTVEIINSDHKTICLGIIVSRERVAFPTYQWEENQSYRAKILCSNGDPQSVAFYELDKVVLWEHRLFKASSIIEVKVNNFFEERNYLHMIPLLCRN